MDQTRRLREENVLKLLLEYSIPAVIAMLVNAIYNIVDRMFIGQYVGEDALAALTVAHPFMMIILALAGMVGAGSAALISIRLGEKDEEGANYVWGNMLSIMTLVSFGAIAVGVLCMDNLLVIFGAQADVIPYAKAYLSIIFIGILPQCMSYGLKCVARTEGQPRLAMIAMVSAGITNIILDFLFIVVLGLGVKGAAVATVIGQTLGLCIISTYFIRGKSRLRTKKKYLKLQLKVMRGIAGVGGATCITMVGSSFAMLALNNYLVEYGGNQALTAMGAINSLYTLFLMPVMGVQQGMQPIVGYNHGAMQMDRVRKAVIYALSITIIFSIIIFMMMQLAPQFVMGWFLDPESDTMRVGIEGLRLFTLALPLLSINIVGTGYFQSVAATKTSIFLGSARQFIFLVPIVIIIAPLLGIRGVWLATPIADMLSIVATLIFLVPALRTRDKGAQAQTA